MTFIFKQSLKMRWGGWGIMPPKKSILIYFVNMEHHAPKKRKLKLQFLRSIEGSIKIIISVGKRNHSCFKS